MADFEEFLIAEFNEQHNNMRQIETSMTQMVQVFFSIEGILLTGALSLLSINISGDKVVAIMAPIFWVLFLFGHITYNIAIYGFVNVLVIDFQNTVVRKYFGNKYGKEEYLYFTLNPEADTGGNHGEWEKVQDNRSGTANFVGVVNTINLVMALGASIFASIHFIYPQVNLLSAVSAYFGLWLVIFIVTILGIHRLYHWAMFLRMVRREERVTLSRRQELLRRISRDILAVESSLE